MKNSLVAISIISALSACGGGSNTDTPTVDIPSNTPATFSGDINANINANESSVTGTLTVTDPDSGEDLVAAQTAVDTTFGQFDISAEGLWTYTLNSTSAALIALGTSDSESDDILVTSVDGQTQVISITVNGVNDIPTFGLGSGVNSATITNTLTTATAGTLSIEDPDDGQSAFEVQNDVLTSYGQFSITAAGSWSYILDTTNPTVSSLAGEDDSIVDDLVVSALDGTRTNILITIVGDSTSEAQELVKGAIGDNDSVPTVNCTTTVSSTSELEDTVSFAMTPGETICLASGNYSGLDLTFGGTGTEDSPITVAAAIPGEVIVGGEVFVGMTGQYVVFQGFIFQDGSMDSSLMQTRANSNTACHNCRITDNAFINMDEGLDDSTKWFQFYGSGNRFDHNWVSGKTTRGALFVVERGDEPGTEDRTLIDHNYFGDRPPKDGLAYAENTDNEYEGIRIGSSDTHTSDSFAVIQHNYFEGIDGEAEVISVKAGNVTVEHNTVRNSRGSIVSRHGEDTTINNNFIIGDGNPFSGGIRVVDANHSVTNNYIQGARNQSSDFYGGILVSASDGSTTNGYQDVENVFVANNTIVDSVNSIDLYAGNRDDLPDSIYVVNNVVADAIGPVVKNADTLPTNSLYAGNYVYGESLTDDDGVTSISGFTFIDPMLTADSNGLYRPTLGSANLTADDSVVTGDYTLPEKDMDGQARITLGLSGADEISSELLSENALRGVLTSDLVGPLSFTPPTTTPHVNKVDIVNDDFDTQTLAGWTNASAEITTEPDEVFSRGSSAKLVGASASLSQTVTVLADTNYTLSAYVKDVGSLQADVDGTTYSADQDSSDYSFTSVSFNSGTSTSLDITASLDNTVLNSVEILNANFDDDQDNWVVNEGSGIGQVQDSDNSASGDDGSIKFTYNEGDSGSPYNPYIAQTLSVEANTDYTLTMYILLKDSDEQDATVLFGAHTGEAIEDGVFADGDIIASKNSVYADLSSDDEADDDFRPDVLIFNSADNTQITIFAQYQSTLGDDIRIDDFSLTSEGAPADDAEAFFDSFRLVSHESLE